MGRRRGLNAQVVTVAMIALGGFVIAPSEAAAQTSSALAPPTGMQQGTVVELDSGDVVIDVGASKGAHDGDEVELWRGYRIKHPVTGAILVDRFRIGTLRLVQVRPNLSLAKPVGALSRPIQTGDLVMAHAAPPPTPTPTQSPSPTPTQSPTPTPTPTPTPSEDAELADLFESLAGTSPLARSVAYGKFLNDHPGSRFTAVLREEIEAMRAADRAARTVAVHATSAPATSFAPPGDGVTGAPLSFGIEIAPAPTGAMLYVRHVGDPAYRAVPMTIVGRGFFVATIPGAEMRAPGMQYFIEAVDARGKSGPIVATAGDPKVVTVVARPQPTPPMHVLASAMVLTDFAAFNAKKLNDYVWQTEGIFAARLGDVGLRALRTGFGVYRGAGGSLQELDVQNLDPRPVGLTYGYLEVEVAPIPAFAIVGRGIVGLREAGVEGGGQLFFRIGNDLKTNLLLGGEVLGGIGLRGIAELDWNTVARVPVVIRTEVTNQPAGQGATGPLQPNEATGGDDVGARLIVQVGYRVTDHLMLALRASYQGRTINHAGPGGGAAVSYQW